MRDKIIFLINRFGIFAFNLALSAVIIILSATLAYIFLAFNDLEPFPILFLAIFIPAVLGPPITYVFLRTVRQLDLAEQDLAKAQKRLIDAINSLPLQLNLYDSDDRLVLTNRSEVGWYKAGGEFFKPGRRYEDIVHDLAYHGHIPRAIGKEDEWIKEQIELFKAAGGLMEPFRSYNRYIEAGFFKTSLGETVSVRRDITQQIEAEEDARHRQSQLTHVMRVSTMGEMASGLAHELNQPLTAITGYLQGCINRLESGEGVSPRVMDALRKSTEQSLRAGEIIRRIRDFVTAADHDYDLIDINDVILETVEMLSSDIRHAKVDLTLDLLSPLPMIRADQIQMQQVVFNLTRNGLDAVNEVQSDGNRIHIASTVDEDKILISVADSGSGIDPVAIDQLFDPFFTTKKTGMGMGLAICRAIINDHGGDIWIENTDNGATAYFKIPIADRDF